MSADTTHATVAAAALAAGARIVNDVSGLRGDRAMADIAAQAEGVVLVASPDGERDGEPLEQVRDLLCDSLARAARAGIARGEIVLDPGIGFFTHAGVPAAAFTCAVLNQLGRPRRPRRSAAGRGVAQGLHRPLDGAATCPMPLGRDRWPRPPWRSTTAPP